MIEQHLGVWLWRGPATGHSYGDYPILLAFNALGGGAAPMFVTLAGIGTSLLAQKRSARGQAVDLTLVRRGLALLAFGLLLNFMTPSWFTWRSWFVLHLMGFGMLIAPLLRRLPNRALLGAVAAIWMATPLVQAALDTPTVLSNPRMAGIASEAADGTRRFVPWAPLRIALAEGQFPIFGWLSFFVAGTWAGRQVQAGRPNAIAGLGVGALAVGASAAVLGQVAHFEHGGVAWLATRIPVPFFPASPALLALLLGAVCLAIAAGLAFERRRPLHEHGWMVTLGRASLTLLLFHVVAFREWTRPLGLWRGLDANAALAVIVAFTALAFVASRSWQRVDYRWGAEWLLRKLAP